MCGICGIYNEANADVVTAMLESIRHRGPDSFATVLFGNHSLGQCGLHIVSSENDILPLTDSHDKIALLFNGEIYNHQELRDELTKEGYVLRSSADSGVIIPLYKKYKQRFVNRLKGMFAIVIIDQDEILLARDKFGIKPLYYFQEGEKLVFGSEMKALLQHPTVPAELDTDALEELTVFGYIFSEERTPLKAIRQVPPGTIITFDGQNISKQKYYTIPQSYYLNNGNVDYQESVDQLTDILFETFTLFHKHGNHDKGLYLSGGVDSTLMAILSQEILRKPIKTYTLYDSKKATDFNYARKVSRAIGSEHHELLVTASDYLNELPNFIYHYENVVAGGVFDVQGALAFQILSKHISEHHKVAFTGEGADELFGGYYWIYTHPLGFSDRIRQRASRLPIYSKVRTIVDELFPYPENEKAYRRNLFDILVRSGLSNYHLWSVDRSCSSFGFEARPPYLYDDVAEFALSLPIEFKVPNKKTTKRIIKDAALPFLKKYNLSDIASRKKYGMPAALDHIGPQIKKIVANLISDDAAATHPYSQYLASPMDVLMFDLFYYFIIHKRCRFDHTFSIQAFYKDQINESMYNQQIPPNPRWCFS
ncbi:MAG: asparagine synthase (glutamine-hydrolyzing) [Deltaproteobacteria bacterium]|nr:asparagine synthase (glutamine-hydrolyzing) [Deltaproteobacteria bacterium]